MGDRASADALRWILDLVLDQGRADMADLPGGASGLLCRDYKGKNADRLVTRIGPVVVSLVAELRGQGRQRPRNWLMEDRRRGAQAPRRLAGGDHAGDVLYYGGA
jgi:hypothetical protein